MEMTPYQQYIFKSRYARYLPAEKRRETWEEAVDRYINFFKAKFPKKKVPWNDLRNAIVNMEIMPSMRALMTAGPALEKDNVAGYNCAYVAIDDTRVFDEIMYILMCGTGVGFSVERQYISKLPTVGEHFHSTDTIISVRDSKIGWASAFSQLISSLYRGLVPSYDLSKIRPRGTALKTFGGRASGPEPLDHLFKYTISLFKKAAGRQLNSLELHDLVCKIAEVVVCGGVRRSALLSLSNLSDQRMKQAKSGDWYGSESQRALANNSVCYTERPALQAFMDEWFNLYRSRSGERGIFNRVSANKGIPFRRKTSGYTDYGTNPCSEIILRSKQFCNLTEVILRPGDTQNSIKRKVNLATILGTLQSTLTDFRYLSKEWKRNTDEERLLGVSLTGIMDHLGSSMDLMDPDYLETLKKTSIKVNKKYAKILRIPASTAITCVKPSGTVSQLCGTSSGIHPRYAPYYIRRVRADSKDPLCVVLQNAGIPNEPSRNNPNELVFSFPQSSPDGSLTVESVSGIGQLNIWQHFNDYWCEHKPSCTIYVRDTEWFLVGDYVYKNFDKINGLSFFPFDDHLYDQAPYEKITKERYEELMKDFPKSLNFDIIENLDTTTGSQEMACTGGACEL